MGRGDGEKNAHEKQGDGPAGPRGCSRPAALTVNCGPVPDRTVDPISELLNWSVVNAARVLPGRSLWRIKCARLCSVTAVDAETGAGARGCLGDLARGGGGGSAHNHRRRSPPPPCRFSCERRRAAVRPQCTASSGASVSHLPPLSVLSQTQRPDANKEPFKGGIRGQRAQRQRRLSAQATHSRERGRTGRFTPPEELCSRKSCRGSPSNDQSSLGAPITRTPVAIHVRCERGCVAQLNSSPRATVHASM